MGRYFDFNQPKPWASGVGSIFDDLSSAIDDQHKLEAQNAEIANKKASTAAFENQVKAQNRKLDIDEKRANFKFRQDETAHDAEVAKAIHDAATSGNTGLAQALAAASQRTDPVTGNAYGVSFKPEDAGPEPPPNVEPEMPAMLPTQPKPDAFVGPVEPPEVARARAIAEAQGVRPAQGRQGTKGYRPATGPTQPPAPGSAEELMAELAGGTAENIARKARDERGQLADAQLQNDINRTTFARKKADYDVQQAAYEPTKAAYDERVAHPNFTIGVGGQNIAYNPKEAKNAKTEEMRQTAARLRDQASKVLARDPSEEGQKVVNRMLIAAANIEAEIPPAAAGAVNNAASQTDAESVRQGMQGKQIESNEKIAGIKANATVAAARARGTGGTGGNYLGHIATITKMMEDAIDENGQIVDPGINGKIADYAAANHVPAGGKDGWQTVVKEVTRGRAISDRTGRANSALEATDYAGKNLGTWKPGQADKGNKAEADFGRVAFRLDEVIKNVKAKGARVLSVDDIAMRESLFTELASALRVYNNLNATDFSTRLEQKIQGAMGSPTSFRDFVMGANPGVLEAVKRDAEAYHRGTQKVRLKSGSGEAAAPRPNRTQNIAAGARGQKGPAPAPEGKRVKFRGQTGTLSPDGTFHPDGG